MIPSDLVRVRGGGTRVSAPPSPGPARRKRGLMTTSAWTVALELRKLLRTSDRFRDLRERYDCTVAMRDNARPRGPDPGAGHSLSEAGLMPQPPTGSPVAESLERARHQRVGRVGGTLNRARLALGERTRRCRQCVHALTVGPVAPEHWAVETHRRLSTPLTELTHAMQRTLPVHSESGAAPAHVEILDALRRHESEIRACGQYLCDVVAAKSAPRVASETAGQVGAVQPRRPVPKPNGWTKSELVAQARDAAGSFSASTFDNIRKAANVEAGERGGKGQQRRFSRAELTTLIGATKAGTFRNKIDIANSWRELLAQ